MSSGELGRWVGSALTWGGLAAVLLLAMGVVIRLVIGEPEPPPGTSLVDVLRDGGAASIVAAGLLGLSLVPIAELAVAAVAFGRSREHRYLLITVVVLGLLLIGLVTAIVAAPALGG